MDKYVGKRLDGRYEIKEIIGVGGMAYVYKAYDSIDDRIVAVKILKDEYLANEEFTRRVKNESKAIAILSHPNIAKVYDVSFGERLQYIVMEYIDGITLKEYIDQQRDIKWKEAVHFTVQILRALQHAHDKGIVHRDIKPQNIMLLPDGTIKVTDFGIARFSRNDLRATSATDKAIGSVHYISPEQARGDITDEKADIYSTGVMLYEMLTGRLPFEADSAVSVAIMQLQSEPKMPREINPEIPEGLEEITMKAMQKDPAKRYQSAAEMLYDIDEFKRNPSIHFAYKYIHVDETPTKFVEAITRVKGEEPADELAEASPDELAEAEEAEEEKKGPPVLPILAAIAGAFVVVGLIFVAIVFFFQFGSGGGGDTITVENFVGKTQQEILNNPEYAQQYDFHFEPQYDKEAPKGTIIGQNVEPGLSKRIKVEITLTVSDGQHMVSIPEIKPGEHKDEVFAKLKAEGFVPQETVMSSDEVAVDCVIKTSPSYPDQAVEGSTVMVFVSTGEEEPEPITVPKVVDLSLADAINQLRTAGFQVNEANIKRVNSSSVLTPDVVLEQSLPNGSSQSPGTEVVLTVSSGYQDVEVYVQLPGESITAALEFYLDGVPQESLNNQYKKVLLKDTGSIRLTFGQQKESYKLTVRIKPEYASKFTDYVTYTLNGKTGSANITDGPHSIEAPASTTTTSTTQEPTSEPTTTTTGESSEPTGGEDPLFGDED